jgi:hypothetical protein
VQFLKKNNLQMLVITEDIYLTWISTQPYGVKLSVHGRYFKIACQWGKNHGSRADESGTDTPS